MSNAIITEQYLTDTADAIREKLGTTQLYTPPEFSDAIASISGGSADLVLGAIRPDAELVQRWTYDKYIVADEGKTLPSYTTSAYTIKNAETLGTASVDIDAYDCYELIRTLAIPIYNITTVGRGRLEYLMNVNSYEYIAVPGNTFHSLVDPSTKYTERNNYIASHGNIIRGFYYNSATIVQITSSTYGPYLTGGTPSVSISGSLATFTVKSPSFHIRGSSSVFSSTYMDALTDIRYQYVVELYRAPKGNLNYDAWENTQQILHIQDCIDNNNNTLT